MAQAGDDSAESSTQLEGAPGRRFRELEDYKAALDAHAIVAVTDARGIITYANDKFCAISKWPREEVIESDHRIINSGHHPREFIRDLWDTIRAGRIWRGELKNHARDGSSYWVDTTIVPFLDDQGKPFQYIAIRAEITERKRLEEQLRESQRLQSLGTLAGGIAHDFNNIVAAILGNVELAIEDTGEGNASVIESLNEIQLAARHARDLVQQILAFSRRRPAARKLLALAPLIEGSERLLRVGLPGRIALELRCAADVPAVLADASQIQQVLMNLGSNAVHAVASGPGRIGITVDAVTLDAALAEEHPELRALCARRPGAAARIEVSDTGAGMDETTLARVFEPFFTTKPVSEGTGLGLSAAHGIVEAHEGAIRVESAPGKGSRFTVYLPQAVTNSVLQEAPPSNFELAAHAAGQRILYIDDDEALLSMVGRLLGRRGLNVTSFSKPDEALAALRADPSAFDLVLSDYNMPDHSGLDVARMVREIRADLPVAIASGFVDEALIADARKAGVTEVLFKADAIEEFCAVILRLAPPGIQSGR